MKNKLIRGLLLVVMLIFAKIAYAQNIPVQPTTIPGAESKVYKTIGNTQLLLHIFYPAGHTVSEKLPTILFFFGGGWTHGDVMQFVPQSKYLASRGMIAIVADYRVKLRHGVTPFECDADAKSAVRWLRTHAAELGIDENRIVAAGGSAGGQLAACTAFINGFDEKSEDLSISTVPNALVLFNPALDLSGLEKRTKEDWGKRVLEISPRQHIKKHSPPTIIFQGTADTLVLIQKQKDFCKEMKKQGNRCELVSFKGRHHGFFNYKEGKNPDYFTTVRKTDEFLKSIGYLKGKPTIKEGE